MSMIKVIIFDFQDVLINDWRDVFDLPELKTKSVAIVKFFDDHNDLRKEMQYGRLSEDEFWKQFIYFTNANVTVDQLKNYVRKTLQPFPEVMDIAESLKLNYKLVILSNFTKEWAEHLIEKYKFNEIFDDMFWSFQNGIKKPVPEAYLQVAKKFKVRPDECLLIDDKERNVKGAKDVGMKTILYKNPAKLKEELNKMGVKVD